MFTGIVEEMGVVRHVRPGGLVIQAHKVLEGTKIGDSIAVNGTCLTVTDLSGDSFSVDTVPETLRRTNLGELGLGDAVNLERALAFGERMGGHFVQGHVEGTGRMVAQEPDGEALLLTFSALAELMPYIVPKGFIAIDGISLT
ncbi:MAG: riboflavin synthase, partial [Chloroflexi bacterium]|nr:riboflavin synthase [Chloroflexota bacterium]